MQRMFELADSEISRIEATPSGLCIHFSAALLRLGDAPAHTSALGCSTQQWGYSNGVTLRLAQVAIEGDVDHCTGRLAGGTLLHGDQRLLALPLPSQWHATMGLLRLDLQCANGAWLRVQAQSLQCDETAGAGFVEVFKC